MSPIQLDFKLRTSTNVKTVHLLGSWDNYTGQLPLSKDATKAGSWKGAFRFQNATLQAGKRYWYYYIMDGYHVSHDPARPFTKEPTTGRSLNILDVPATAGAHATSHSAKKSVSIPTGRGLSPSRIAHPKPSKPYASRKVREADYSMQPDMDDLASQLDSASLYSSFSKSPASSISSGSSRSSGGSSYSSLSDRSSPASSISSASSCRCNRYGITRKGDKVLLDCGGARCGYSDDSSSACSSSDSEIDDSAAVEETARKSHSRAAPTRTTRRGATTIARRR